MITATILALLPVVIVAVITRATCVSGGGSYDIGVRPETSSEEVENECAI